MKLLSTVAKGFALPVILCLACVAVTAQNRDYTRYVNPFIGTGGHGHTFPGATMPFGMVQLSPDTRTDNWDGSSGYHYSDDIIYGFSHTHLSGTGIPDYCDILFMPTIGEPQFFAKEGDRSVNGYASKFSHANEHAEPGYYSVKLDDDGILAEMTATTRVGMHRYTFPQSNDANIILDLKWRDKVLDSDLKFVGKTRVEGFRRSSSWAQDQVIYFVAEFSKPFAYGSTIVSGNSRTTNAPIDHKDIKAVFRFKTTAGETILVKVALSPDSIEGARKNLAAELPGWDFDKIRAGAKATWNKELSKIEVSGGTDAQITTFYTALYHTMIQPNIFQDVDGNYLGHDGKIHNVADDGVSGHGDTETRGRGASSPSKSPRRRVAASPRPSDEYTVFSLWDTFRAAHPLYTIIDQKRTVDFINTFIRQYEQGGRLPVWELAGNETDCMIGYHAVSVIADAMDKGIKGFDYEKAYEAAKHSAELDREGLAAYKKQGFISSEDTNESVSKTLEYAYDDWCIAQMAKIISQRRIDLHEFGEAIKSREETKKYETRAHYFENLFDSSTGFMRPKRNGGFISPFAPNEVTFNYTEGNAWVYSFFVPQDISRLIALQGGREKFVQKLDELFTTTDKLTGREQPDITGLIGQYAHGNEPSHHIAYLYDYAGEPWKTQKLVRKIMDEFYKPEPDGLIGNEDCGQMSAWYILSTSGFYEVAPGDPVYAFGTPLFKEVKYNLENGKSFTIKAPNVSAQNIYIRSVTLNGQPYKKAFITHDDIMNGGTLVFTMTDQLVTTAFTEYPRSGISGDTPVVPAIEGERVFTNKTTINIKKTVPSMMSWKMESASRKTDFQTEFHPFDITETTTITAQTMASDGKFSPLVSATFHKRPNDWHVISNSGYSQYTGGGDDGLIDGLRGTVNFSSGEWQGYHGKTFEAVIDMQRETPVTSVGGSFLQDTGSWIWMPVRITFEGSTDGTRFYEIADIKTNVPLEQTGRIIGTFSSKDKGVANTPGATGVRKWRYIRVRAYNIGKVPSWHPDAGEDPWIFVDEILIN